MRKERTEKRVTELRPNAARRTGRQRLRWRMMSERFWEKMKTQNWSKMAMDREEWNRIVEQAKTYKEL